LSEKPSPNSDVPHSATPATPELLPLSSAFSGQNFGPFKTGIQEFGWENGVVVSLGGSKIVVGISAGDGGFQVIFGVHIFDGVWN